MEPNSRSTRRGKIRWLWVFAVVAVFGIAAVARWLTKPLPPPVVSLSLVSFKVYPTNIYAVIAFTNQSPKKLYFARRNWRAEFETPAGMVTNRGFPHGSLAAPFHQHEGRSFNVELPEEIIRWRVVAYFEWFERRKPRVEALEWLDEHVQEGRFQKALETVLGPVLGHLPEDFELYDFVTTPWLTNLPPASILSEESSVGEDATN